MILECEKCATRYLVDTSDIGVLGRMVRCAECGHDWFATTDGAKPSPKVEPQAEPAPTPEAPVTDKEDGVEEVVATGGTNLPAIVPETNDRTAALILFVGAMALGLFVLYLVFGRAQIMAVWPPAQHAFAVLGLEQPVAPSAPSNAEAAGVPASFVLHDVAIERVGSTVTLTGKVQNEGGMAAPAPSLSIVEYDADGNVVATTNIELEGIEAEIAPGAAAELNLVHGLTTPRVVRVRVGIQGDVSQP